MKRGRWARLKRTMMSRRVLGMSAAALTAVAVGATIVVTIRPDSEPDGEGNGAVSEGARPVESALERGERPATSVSSSRALPPAPGAAGLIASPPRGGTLSGGGGSFGGAATTISDIAGVGGLGGLTAADLRRLVAVHATPDGGVLPHPVAPIIHPSHPAASDAGIGAAHERASPEHEHERKSDRSDGGVAPRARLDDRAEESRTSRRSAHAEDGEEFRRVTRFVTTEGAVLKGRVLEAETERPVANAIIEARMGGSFIEARSDAAGLFRIAGMAPASRVAVWVQSESNGFIAEHADVLIPGEGETADTGTIHVLKANEFAGDLGGWLGMLAGRRSGLPAVSAVNPWLPAERAGVQVGDKLLSVDGRDVRELGTRGINYLLRGPVGSKVTLLVQSTGAPPRKVTLERVQR